MSGWAALLSGLDQHLKQETGVDIGLLKVPRLRLAFNEQDATALQAILVQQQQFLQGLEWLNGESARKIEPLLSPKVQEYWSRLMNIT